MNWIRVGMVDDGDLVEAWQKDGTVRATAARVYFVEADETVTQDQCLGASIEGGPHIPLMMESYTDTRPNCRVRRRIVTKETSHKAKVTCEYEDPTDGSSSDTLASKPARISWSPETFQEAYQVDAHGTKVCNAANEAFDNPPSRQGGVRVYTIKKFVDAATMAAIDATWNTVCTGAKTISGHTWDAQELWMQHCTFDPVDGSSLWEAVLTVKAKKGGWKDVALNVGCREISGREIRLDSSGALDFTNGEAPLKPWPLNSTGHAITPPLDIADERLTTCEFWPYTDDAWTGVPLS